MAGIFGGGGSNNLLTSALFGTSVGPMVDQIMNKPEVAKPTAAPAAAVMPTPDDDMAQRARRRRIAAASARGGRASTILTGDRLGD